MPGLEILQAPSKKLWVYAAVGAVVLHLGCIAFAALHLQTDDAEDDLGAAGLEIGLEIASPRLTPTDLPPGPDSEASVASPAVAEQKTTQESELPKAVPTETHDPDRLVTLNNSQKPKENDPNVKAARSAPSSESSAAEATAMPSSEMAQVTERSTTRDHGTGDSRQRTRTTWQRSLWLISISTSVILLSVHSKARRSS